MRTVSTADRSVVFVPEPYTTFGGTLPTRIGMSINKSIFYTTAVQLPSVALGFGTGICITRLLQDVGRGYYTVLQSDVVLLSLLISFNLGAGLLFFLAKEGVDKKRSIGIAASAMLIIGVLLASLLAYAWYYGLPANPLLPEGIDGFYYVAYLVGTLFFSLSHSFFNAIFLGLRLFRIANQMTLISAILMAAVFGTLFFWLRSSPGAGNLPMVLLCSFLILLVLNALWLVYYMVHVRVRPVLFTGGELLRPLASFVFIGYVANLLNQLNYRFDIWYLQDVRGAGELGLYAVAVGVAQFFFQVPEPLSRVLQPHLIGQFDDEMLGRFRLYARLSFTLVLVGGTVFMFLAGWMFSFLYGDAFARSALAFRWLMPGILFACASKMMALLVVRTGKVGYNALASGVGLVFTVLLNVFLVPKYGLVGAAIASTAAYLAVLLVVLWAVFRRLGVPWGNYYILMPGDLGRLLK